MLSGDPHVRDPLEAETGLNSSSEGALPQTSSENALEGSLFVETENEGLTSKLEFLLASMRVASLNLKSWSNEIDMIGTALKHGLVTVETACEWLHEMGVLRWLPCEQIETPAD